MKTTTLLFLCVFFVAISAMGQGNSNLIIFTEDNSKFFLFLNNVQQHETAESNVLVTNLTAPAYKLKMVFEDAQRGIFEKTLYFPEESSEITYQLVEKKGALKLKPFSILPLPETYTERPNQQVVVYTTEPVLTQTTTTVHRTNPEGVNMNMNVGGNGINVNVSINDNMNGVYYEETTTTVVTGTSASEHYVMQGYSGPIGCPWPMEAADFQDAKRIIASKSWDETRLSLARQIVGANCLFADQVRDLVKLMEWEETKLAFAKFAYDYTYDPGNYFKVSQAFEWEASTEELNAYISNR